jgi:hypothetical protein
MKEKLYNLLSIFIPQYPHWQEPHVELVSGESSIGGNHTKPPFSNNKKNMWNGFCKVDINKLVRFDLKICVTQMQHYFSLHGINYS